MAPHDDYQLPGILAQPSILKSSMMTAAFSYSRRWNKRRLEHHHYGLWTTILFALIFDLLQDIILIPQLALYQPRGHADNSTDPNTSGITEPLNNLFQRLPDFVLMAIISCARDNKPHELIDLIDYNNWPDLKLIYASPFVLVEIKRALSRRIRQPGPFSYNMQSFMLEAMTGAESQALVAFNGKVYNPTSIILIAATGEWWAFRIIRRAQEMGQSKQRAVHASRPLRVSKESKDSSSRIFRPTLHSEPKGIQQVYQDLDLLLAFVKESWSGCMSLGSAASNQCFYVIHEELKKMHAALDKSQADEENLSSMDDDAMSICSEDSDELGHDQSFQEERNIGAVEDDSMEDVDAIRNEGEEGGKGENEDRFEDFLPEIFTDDFKHTYRVVG